MPIDFTVLNKNGESQNYHIPNTWFVKKTNATVLNKWYGFGKCTGHIALSLEQKKVLKM